jgi:heterodisulfide reductase subunit C
LERFKLCIQCGKCTGGCPSGRRTAWRIRKIFEEIRLGLREEVFSDDDLWNCTTCYTCQERCPRGLHTTDIVRIIRNLAVKHGYIKSTHRRVSEILIRYGHAVPVNDEIRKIRKDLGLDEVPPTVHGNPEELKDFLKIIEETGFKKTLEEATE